MSSKDERRPDLPDEGDSPQPAEVVEDREATSPASASASADEETGSETSHDEPDVTDEDAAQDDAQDDASSTTGEVAEPVASLDEQDDDGAEAPRGAWRRLGAELRPRTSRSQVLAGVLCAALGFALVVQVQQSSSDQLSSARQDDLVRLLEEVTDRAEQLSTEVAELEGTRDELQSGTNKAASALELAQERAASEGILSGRLPAQGPGVRVRITDPGGAVEAAQLFNVLEELRNAGAEVVAVNGVRLVTSTWFRDREGSIVVDDHAIGSPYEWTVIGDPATLDRALEIPGGALATVRTAGAEATTTRHDKVTVDEVREPSEPEYATPQEADR